MDIDVMGKHIHGLLAFKDKIEGMISGADSEAKQASSAVQEVISLKVQLEGALPDIEKLIADSSLIADDIAKIKKDLAPALEWIAEQQKAAAAEKQPTSDVDKPLDHLAEVEASLNAGDQPAEHSDTDQPVA